MLSISGLHVALIALALQLAFEIARLPRRRADIATVVVIGGYVALLGAPAPALRSAVMLGLLIATRLAQRPTSPWAILALGALVPLGDPRIVLDVGWQLSTAGVAALIAASAFARRVRWLSRQRGVARTVLHGAVASTVATIVSAPLVAWSFGRLSLIGPASNLVAGPIMTIAQPMLFLSLVASPVPALARFIADAAHPLLVAFDAVASAAAAVPGASIAVAPTATTAALAGVAVIAMIVACVARFPARPAATALAAMAAMAWVPMHAPGVNRTELHVIDVGQGDAIALRTMRGHWVLLDAGRIWQGGDAGRATIVPYLAHRGGTLSAFILSHPHDDHVGGAASVIHALRPARWFDGAYTAGGDAYQRALLEARRDGVAWTRVHPGDSLTVDEATITFLAPDSAWVAAQRDANEASAVALVRVGGIRMLLTGDAERGEEEWMLARDPAALRADVLKVGHHGSTTSTTPGFLAAVSPRIALVSVGAGNVYGHPDADVLQRLAAAGVQVLRTDRLSTIVVRTDGRTLEVEAGGDRWTVAPRD
jgi:competence protein ComEC